MTLTPFIYKRYKSDLDIHIIVKNFSGHATVPAVAPGEPMAARRPKFDVKVSDNRFILSRNQGASSQGKINLQPIAHGKLKEGQDFTKINIFIRPFYTDILFLVGLCALQLYCTYASIAGGYYIVAVFSLLSIILAYTLVVVKFQAECRNYLALIQKCI